MTAHDRRETGAWAILLGNFLELLLAHEVNRLKLLLIVHNLHLVLIADILESHAAYSPAEWLVTNGLLSHSVCCPLPRALTLNTLAWLLAFDAVLKSGGDRVTMCETPPQI